MSSGSAWYAYNATRESFVHLRIRVADTWWSRLRSGEGMWLPRSRTIHTFGLRHPLDVIYLDANLLVIDVVESLGPQRIGPLRRRCESVLTLPWRSIHESGTEIGDQFLIGAPRAMQAHWVHGTGPVGVRDRAALVQRHGPHLARTTS